VTSTGFKLAKVFCFFFSKKKRFLLHCAESDFRLCNLSALAIHSAGFERRESGGLQSRLPCWVGSLHDGRDKFEFNEGGLHVAE
jgi:hypothetical protein